MNDLKDTGARTTYESGAQREFLEEKGRHDLLPFNVLAELYVGKPNGSEDIEKDGLACRIFSRLHRFVYGGDAFLIVDCVWDFFGIAYASDEALAIKEVALQYGRGVKKYGERNWEKGLPLSSCLASGVRHFLQWRAGHTDEPHDAAFVWNMFGLIHTIISKRTDLFDLPFHTQKENDNTEKH